MTTQTASFVAHFFNRSNVLIVRFDVASMEAARVWATEYNRDPGALGQVEFIGNYSKISLCTRLTTMQNDINSLPLFGG